MRILITGGNGFIGSHLTGALIERGHDVSVLCRSGKFRCPSPGVEGMKAVSMHRGDIQDGGRLPGLIKDADVITHNAASVGVSASAALPHKFIDTNIGGTSNLTHALRSAGHRVRTVILGSSVSVYGEGNYSCASCGTVRPALRYVDMTAGADGLWDPPCPSCGGRAIPVDTPESADRRGESVYAVTKKAQEDLLAAACSSLGIGLVIMRYTTVYGPGQRESASPYVRFLRMLAAGEPPLVCEDGRQSRDFIYVGDVVRANLSVVESQLSGINAFNIGSGVQSPLRDFVGAMAAAVAAVNGMPPVEPVISGRFTAGDVRHCYADCRHAEALIGFRARTSLAGGLSRLVKWFLPEKGLRRAGTAG